jgi:ATP-dependent exoDNAse (exonuclease V) beta subunit
MSRQRPSDQDVRDAALDPASSFVVQAPAGSGKTGLLIQRYLRLLATVDHPEEIVAITFTRKAAAEMRDRVLDALVDAQTLALAEHGHSGGVGDPHREKTIALARAVLERDAQAGWALLAQPGRLRILTIDALCRSIATQMPWLSRLGGDARIVEDVSPLYRRAARDVVSLLHDDTPWSGHVATLVAHLDGDVGRFERMLVEMLSRRDQWLRYLLPGRVASGRRRAELEAELARAVGDALRALRAAVPPELTDDLIAACAYAGETLRANGVVAPAAACADLSALPGADPADLPLWRGIAAMLLTRDGSWRKTLTKRDGFPADKEPRAMEMRALGLALLEKLATAFSLRERLHGAPRLPEPRYTDAQWDVLDALLEVLPVATAFLRTVFAAGGQVDYSEITTAARQALGGDEAPTDLALALDYRIRHLLVDEFQDTSHSHFALLQQLTAGWSPEDGRTLFLVGDPMQSIYRFREADVGLFLDVAAHGLPGLAVVPLRLGANFRSRRDVVAWINGVFPQVMPAGDDPVAGAVRFTPSVASVEGDGGEGGVHVHALFRGDEDARDHRDAEALGVADVVIACRARDAASSIALLVRSRTHLEAILPRLREAGVRYRGVDIEPLAEVPAVEDLLSLTRALLHPADRAAWLAVLRAPWCGMTLADLHALVAGAPGQPVLALLENLDVRPGLSDDGRRRAARVLAVLGPAVAERGRRRLRRWVEGAWTALGGPACVTPADTANTDTFLELLDTFDGDGIAVDANELARRAAELYAAAPVEAADVEIMTMHKAKGLEFDVVIVPGLERAGAHDDRHLLAWTKRAGDPEDTNILLAPIPSPAEEAPPIYDYLRGLEAEKDVYEQTRLLYVAATRARHALHLFGTASVDEDGAPRAPAKRSLLARLWPVLGGAFEEARGADGGTGPPSPAEAALAGLRRVPADWRTPPPPAPLATAAPVAEPEAERAPVAVEFDWSGETARHVGTVIHRGLMDMSRDGADAWDGERLARRRHGWRAMLAGLGIPEPELPAAAARVEEALGRVLADPRGRWLLDPDHEAARSELALCGVDGGAVTNVVIDRSFVDADGVRWIVDYKSGRHEGGDSRAFLDREQERYREQLERYGRLMSAMDGRPIRLALYFPVLAGWREWSPTPVGMGS